MGLAELRQRRDRFADLMPACSVAVLPSAPQRYMSGVIPYPYRQDADFRYLTGINQQGLAIFHKEGEDSGATLRARRLYRRACERVLLVPPECCVSLQSASNAGREDPCCSVCWDQ